MHACIDWPYEGLGDLEADEVVLRTTLAIVTAEPPPVRVRRPD